MKLITSSSPHIRSGETTRRVMGTVLLALLPTLLAGVWFFGPRALLLVLVTVAACVVSEWVFLAVSVTLERLVQTVFEGIIVLAEEAFLYAIIFRKVSEQRLPTIKAIINRKVIPLCLCHDKVFHQVNSCEWCSAIV